MNGISHITLICKDLQKTSMLLCDLFSAVEVYSSEENTFSLSKEKFFTIGDLWIAIMEGNPIERSYNHIAFHVDEKELSFLELKILEYGLEVLPGRSRHPKEGKSIYFYDYDNHLFEFHTGNLTTRLHYYQEQ